MAEAHAQAYPSRCTLRLFLHLCAAAALWISILTHSSLGALVPGLPVRSICSNTCSLAKNGVCEEGRPPKGAETLSKPVMAYCDLGTDCEDCGPWNTTAPATATYWEDNKKPGPVRMLRARDVQVRVRTSGIPKLAPWEFAYTDPAKDVDVSFHMEGHAMVEPQITKTFYWILKDRCRGGSQGLFLDVGSNFGWFAILAASLGCRVIAYEPVPLFRWFLEYNVHLNDLTSRVEIRTNLVSNEAGKSLRMVVPTTGIWGTAGIGGLNIDTTIEGKKEEIEVPSVRLENEVKQDVTLMKVDVEGWEWSVIQGAAGLLRSYNVENIVMEYSPGVPGRHYDYAGLNATVLMLVDLVARYGYRIGHICAGCSGSLPDRGGPFDQPLRPMAEVTLDNLKYDYIDVQRTKARRTGPCHGPEGMHEFPAWRDCFGNPEAMSPRSFTSQFGHNTNLWLSKDPTFGAKLNGSVGIFRPDDPPTKYFQDNVEGWGMGARRCDRLEPAVQVRNRCRCTKPEVCGAEQAAVERLAATPGALPQNYVLGDAKQVLGIS